MHNFETAYPISDWDRWVGSDAAVFPGLRWQRYQTAQQAGWSESALAEARYYAEEIGSAAIMVVFGGAVLIHWGPIARRYKCHSIRKSLLSALYGEHVMRGAIDLDETLGSMGIDDVTPLTDIEKTARVRDLLTSRSGVYLPAAYESPQAKQERPVRGSHAPDTHWCYNNWDFNALATIFNRKASTDLIAALQRQLAAPLQMQDFEPRHCHYHVEPHNSIHPAYPIRMSARDLARVGLLYLRRGQWRGSQLIPSSWVEASTRSYSETHAGGYGYMWWIEGGHLDGLGAYAAAGWGGHRMHVIPRAQLVIVHRVDTYAMPHVGDREIHTLLHKILRGRVDRPEPNPTLVDLPDNPAPERPAGVPELNLDALCGDFAQKETRAIVRRAGDHLELETPDGRFYLFPRSDTEFEIEDAGHRLDFTLDDLGRAAGLRIWWPYEMPRVEAAPEPDTGHR